MKKKKFVKSELIGSTTEIIQSKNKSLIGLKGKIVDETKNMFTIEKNKIIKKMIKSQSKFDFPKQKIQIEGKLLLGRPEDRLKK
ncbi:ribonuclease P protein component 1 [archaeon]|nr:ribonuclease P protein component 1 [archaeon]